MISLKNIIKTSTRGLRAHRSRSALTILGIVIGITSIIIVMSVSRGAANLILGEIQGIGSRTISIQAGKEPKGPSDFAALFNDSLRERELAALQRKGNVPNLTDISPIVVVPGSVSYAGETFAANVMGAAESLGIVMDLYPKTGVFITADDVREAASVAVIGYKVKSELFGESDALGQKIKIRNRAFRVIGILPEKGQSAFFNVDDIIVIPHATAQKYLLGTKHFNEIIGRAEREDLVPKTVFDITATLRELAGTTNPEDDAFHVHTQADAMERVGAISAILTALLTSVAAISLIVGGVGIMNIMLVSVTERTREIGLRKAVGATEKDILRQFLFEAVLLTAIGGIVGIIFGGLLSFAAALVLKKVAASAWQFTLPLSAVILGLGVSTLVGLIFGIYPAREAAKKSPIEALRYE